MTVASAGFGANNRNDAATATIATGPGSLARTARARPNFYPLAVLNFAIAAAPRVTLFEPADNLPRRGPKGSHLSTPPSGAAERRFSTLPTAGKQSGPSPLVHKKSDPPMVSGLFKLRNRKVQQRTGRVPFTELAVFTGEVTIS